MQEYDIVVIGSGCAGLTVAIEAADLGAKVVVLEKMFGPFGNTIYAGGNFNATNTWSRDATASKTRSKISTTIWESLYV